jgi:hypothetical protein
MRGDDDMANKRMAADAATGSPPPFSHPVPVEKLRRDGETPFRVAAKPSEFADLARFLGLDRVERLSFAGFISPSGADGWRIRGRLVAKIEQRCVISLEPVRSRHDIEVDRLYLPTSRFASARDVTIGHDEDDGPDPYDAFLDPGLLAVETLALAADPYPRAAGAELPGGSVSAGDHEEAPGPFAALAPLRERSAKGDG